MKSVNKFLTSGAVITTLSFSSLGVHSALADEVQSNNGVVTEAQESPQSDNNATPAEPDTS
ncbi:hypothetical protein ABLM60_004472, partial [Shigella flexneri]